MPAPLRRRLLDAVRFDSDEEPDQEAQHRAPKMAAQGIVSCGVVRPALRPHWPIQRAKDARRPSCAWRAVRLSTEPPRTSVITCSTRHAPVLSTTIASAAAAKGACWRVESILVAAPHVLLAPARSPPARRGAGAPDSAAAPALTGWRPGRSSDPRPAAPRCRCLGPPSRPPASPMRRCCCSHRLRTPA